MPPTFPATEFGDGVDEEDVEQAAMPATATRRR
jgi:hypothetical protein